MVMVTASGLVDGRIPSVGQERAADMLRRQAEDEQNAMAPRSADPEVPVRLCYRVTWEQRGLETSAVIHPEDVGAFVKFLSDRGADDISVTRLLKPVN